MLVGSSIHLSGVTHRLTLTTAGSAWGVTPLPLLLQTKAHPLSNSRLCNGEKVTCIALITSAKTSKGRLFLSKLRN